MQDEYYSEEPHLTLQERRAQQEKAMYEVSMFLQVKYAFCPARDAGVPFDVEGFCSLSGYDIEEVEAIIQELVEDEFELPYVVSPKDLAFELTGFPIPPDALKPYFDSNLVDSNLFSVAQDPNVMKAFSILTDKAFDREIEAYGLVGFVEAMFMRHFDKAIACILMNSFFWILSYNGDRWLPVRSYALEMLKLFGELIIEYYTHPKKFIEAFSLFTLEVLVPKGICTSKATPLAEDIEEGRFPIRATVAFKTLVRLSDEVIADTLGGR
ncbi:MAG: hypothetical protein RBR15_15555 [Sphaerochaeta sp.]|nr:hypothetical protein [Sphaerochaeta sp.]